MMLEPSGHGFRDHHGAEKHKRFILRPGGLALTDRLVQACAFKAGDRVADVGCGFGATVEHLRTVYGLDATGIDPAFPLQEPGLPYASRLPLISGFAEELPFGSGTLDGIVAECTLSVIANKEQALAEFCRALRSGGKLAITDVYARDPRGAELVGAVRLPFGMTDILTRGTLDVMLKRQGFCVSLFEDHSQALKEYVFHEIMGNDANGACSWLKSVRTLKPAMPGYFLLVAQKES